MATESHPVPALALTALNLLRQQFQQGVNEIGKQAIDAAHLDPALKWNVDFDRGVIERDVPEAKPQRVK